jgi:hypothetical protein
LERECRAGDAQDDEIGRVVRVSDRHVDRSHTRARRAALERSARAGRERSAGENRAAQCERDGHAGRIDFELVDVCVWICG